jgi:hypothetical protein
VLLGAGYLRSRLTLSSHFLGQIAERRGDHARASDYCKRFLQYWGDGEIDSDKVAAAKKYAG